MWLILGSCAVIAAILNLAFAFRHSEAKWLRFSSMAFTALTPCTFYSDAARRVLGEDWSGLIDILPITSKLLWFCVIGSILLNSLSLFVQKKG